MTAKKWLDSIEKQKRSNLKCCDKQSQLLTIILTPRLGAEINIQGGPKKTKPTHNFVKYWPIFKILSLSHSPGNLQ